MHKFFSGVLSYACLILYFLVIRARIRSSRYINNIITIIYLLRAQLLLLFTSIYYELVRFVLYAYYAY